jgi:thiamine biosynthesis lipoprotein
VTSSPSALAPAGMQWDRWSTSMHLLVTDPALLPAARAVVDSELEEVELAASRFRPDSEVSVLAAAGGVRQPVSPMLADLIEAAIGAARFTDGDVDPTVGCAVVNLGYDEALVDGGVRVPWVSSIAVPVDWTSIEFDGASVRIPAGTLLDLGATAKAAAADRCARRVHRETGTGVLANLGGDIATAGPVPEGGWRILVQDNDDDPASHVTIGTDTGLATSSTRRRRWWRAGQAHHHIVDPRTGASAEPVWRSVSVAADSCLAANTVSTAAIVRGRGAPGWIETLGVPARLVGADGREHTIGGWPA